MLTGLKVHSGQNAFKLPDVHEDYNSGDLLADIVKATHPGSSTHKWALKNGATGKVLQAGLTLKQNEVESEHDLHLVPKLAATQDLELEISAPNGKVLQCEAPSSTMTGPFLAKLVRHFELTGGDYNGKPGRWVLVSEPSHEALDPSLSLAENGVAAQDRLSIQAAKAPKILIQVTSPIGLDKGLAEPREASPDTLTSEFLSGLVDDFELPRQTGAGAPIEWLISDWSTRTRLDLAKTLAANGLGSGSRVLIERAKEPDFILEVMSPRGETRRWEGPGGKSTGELLGEQVESFGFAKVNKRGKPHSWSMIDRVTGRELNPEKSLAENMVKTGDQLSLVLETPDLKLEATSPTGEELPTEEPGETSTAVLLRDLVVAFKLAKKDEKGPEIEWLLCRKDSGEVLDLRKTLDENGVVDGERLLIRRETVEVEVEEVITVVRKEEREVEGWLSKNRKLVFGVAAVLLVLAVSGIAAILLRPKKVIVSVAVEPKRSTLSAGESVRLHVEVKDNGSGKLIWSTPDVGSLSSDLVYTAPASVQGRRSVKISATSVEDSTKSDSAEVTLLPPKLPERAEISLSPADAKLKPGESVQFQADLREDVGPTAHWSVDPEVGTVTPTGLYTAPSYIGSPRTVTLTASSEKSPQYMAKASILISTSAPSRILPQIATLTASQVTRFRLAPDPGGGVTWRVSPSVGSMAANGVYTAPALIPDARTLTVTAIPAPDATGGGPRPATATINLQPVIVGAISYTAGANRQYFFRTTVTNAGNKTALWSIEPRVGSISPEGVYTAPAEVQSARTIVITATSQADPAKTSKFDLVLSPPPSSVTVKINPHAPVLLAGQSEQLSATVTGSNNRNVTWALSGLGTMSPMGLYTAPPNVPARGATIRIVVTSNAAPNKSDMQEITLRPAPPYSGPQMGTVTWTGNIGKNQTLSITNNIPNFGSLSGAFPGVPVTVVVSKGSSIVVPPSQANGWKTIVIESQGKQRAISIEWHFISRSAS